MNYFKQIYYEMKHQKMMTWVSISGTALAIFLVMAVIMAEGIYDVAAKPESNRDRLMYGTGMHVKNDRGESSGMALSYNKARQLYDGLEGVEQLSYIRTQDLLNVASAGRSVESMECLCADGNLWSIYDYEFIYGRPFTKEEANAQAKVAVVTRSTARKLFGEEDVTNRQIDVNSFPYTIIGVIEDINPLLTQSYTKIITPYNPANNNSNSWFGDYFGNTNVLLLAQENADIKNIKDQVKQRYDRLNAEVAKDNEEVKYHDQPYTAREIALGDFGSNNGPDTEGHDKQNMLILAILILLPAINLSSMTRSRLRHRVTEIGVRRAFGAPRVSIIRQMFGENMIITLLGGAIGLVLSFVFMLFFSNVFFQFDNSMWGSASLEMLTARPDFGMLFRWSNFFGVLILCFVLNLLSATVPAWKASKVQPASALSSSR